MRRNAPAPSPDVGCLHSRPFPPRCISRRAEWQAVQSRPRWGGAGSFGLCSWRRVSARAQGGVLWWRHAGRRRHRLRSACRPSSVAPVLLRRARGCGTAHFCGSQETCPISTEGWTRRVHFVREGGWGGGSKRGRARPQAPRRVTCHAREGPAAQLLRRKVPRLVRHARGRCQGGRETAALPVRATAPARRLPSCQRPVRAADASGWVYGRRTETGKFCMSMYEEHYVREASP